VTAPQHPAPVDQASAGPLTEQAAAWIRDHAWPPRMRGTFLTAVGFYSTCLCQNRRSHHCARDRHDMCIGTLSGFHTIIGRPDGSVAEFPDPYRHPTESATGPQHETAALVWLADRVCRWVCPCSCHTAPAEPTPVQDALFAIGAAV
jgi:hypothetical protein